MTKLSISNAEKSGRRPVLCVELLLMIGLPLLVLVAGAITTAAAFQQGFTPVAETRVAPQGH